MSNAYKEVDAEGDEYCVLIAQEGVGDDGAQDGREVAGAVQRGEEAQARLLPWRTVSMYTTRFIRRYAIERCALDSAILLSRFI